MPLLEGTHREPPRRTRTQRALANAVLDAPQTPGGSQGTHFQLPNSYQPVGEHRPSMGMTPAALALDRHTLTPEFADSVPQRVPEVERHVAVAHLRLGLEIELHTVPLCHFSPLGWGPGNSHPKQSAMRLTMCSEQVRESSGGSQ